MQNILLFFNLLIAKATPTDMVAGKAGGTVMVMRSSDLSMTYSGEAPSERSLGIVTEKPRMPTHAIIPTKIRASW